MPKCITSKKRKSEKILAIKQCQDEAYSHLKKATEIPDKDECSLYAELLASKLRTLDENIRGYAMLKIDKLIYGLKQQTYYASSAPPQYPSHYQQSPTFIVPSLRYHLPTINASPSSTSFCNPLPQNLQFTSNLEPQSQNHQPQYPSINFRV